MSSLILLALAGVACAEVVPSEEAERRDAPSNSGTPGQFGVTEEAAATFAIRAIAGVGLLDPTGEFYDYKSIEKRDTGWVVTFDAEDCSGSLETGACSDGPDTHGQVHVALQGEVLSITQTTGPFAEAVEHDLLEYHSAAPTPQEPHFEYPYVEIVDLGDGETGILGSYVWTGPIPYGQSEDVAGGCEGYVSTKQGELVFKGVASSTSELKLDVPDTEELRSGGISGVPLPPDLDISVEGLKADIRCAPNP